MIEKRDKVNIDDIIGLIKTDERTDSVEEVRKLRGRDENNFYWYKKYKEVLNENEKLKQFISKIDFAIIRKYDNSLENLLDEVYDGEYENWVKKQVSRAKKLDGDV